MLQLYAQLLKFEHKSEATLETELVKSKVCLVENLVTKGLKTVKHQPYMYNTEI